MPRAAAERKKIHDSSEHVFPKSERIQSASGRKVLTLYDTTSYKIDYAKKEGKPAIPRPCSVTRRNRPHPSQNFLNWRIPSKPLLGDKLNNAQNFINLSAVETRERFYDDYVGRYKLPSELGNYYPTRPGPRRKARSECSYFDRFELSSDILPNRTAPPLCMLDEAIPDYNKLVAISSSSEKIMVEKCFDAADQGMLRKNLAHAIRPDAIPAIQQWLKCQNGKDRKLVVNFLGHLGKAGNTETDEAAFPCIHPGQQMPRTATEVSKAGRDAILSEVRKEVTQQTGKPRYRVKYHQPKRGQNALRFPPRRDIRVNKHALFMQPHRLLPGHFEIHPEFHAVESY